MWGGKKQIFTICCCSSLYLGGPNRFIKSLQNSVKRSRLQGTNKRSFPARLGPAKTISQTWCYMLCGGRSRAKLFFFFFSSTFNSSQVVQSFFFGGPLGRRIVRPLCVFKKSFKAPSQKVIYYRTGNTEHSVPASLQHHVYITHGCPWRSVWFGHWKYSANLINFHFFTKIWIWIYQRERLAYLKTDNIYWTNTLFQSLRIEEPLYSPPPPVCFLTGENVSEGCLLSSSPLIG